MVIQVNEQGSRPDVEARGETQAWQKYNIYQKKQRMTLHLVDKFKQMTNKMKYNTSCECGWMLLGRADAKLMMLMMMMASYGW